MNKLYYECMHTFDELENTDTFYARPVMGHRMEHKDKDGNIIVVFYRKQHGYWQATEASTGAGVGAGGFVTFSACKEYVSAHIDILAKGLNSDWGKRASARLAELIEQANKDSATGKRA